MQKNGKLRAIVTSLEESMRDGKVCDEKPKKKKQKKRKKKAAATADFDLEEETKEEVKSASETPT